MKKMIIAYRVLVALGLFLFLIGLANLALDYQLGSFQLLSILLATGGIVCTGFASIMVDDCKIRAKTAWHIAAVDQTNEEIDEKVENKIALGRLRDDILDSIKAEFYPDGDDDAGVQCLLEEIEGKFNAYIRATQ